MGRTKEEEEEEALQFHLAVIEARCSTHAKEKARHKMQIKKITMEELDDTLSEQNFFFVLQNSINRKSKDLASSVVL